MIDPLILALLTAIASLATTCGVLYGRGEKLHARLDRATELIFALLQQRRDDRGERPPPTVVNTPSDPRAFDEAQAHAERELNGSIGDLLQRYLAGDSTPPTPRRVDPTAVTAKASDRVIQEAMRRSQKR